MLRLAILLFVASATLSAQAPPADEIKRVLGLISEITGLEAKRPVPSDSITREGWKQFVENEIRENVKPEEIRGEELALKKFGLLPADFDLRQATIDLLGEQAAAIYDHRKKRMLFVEGGANAGLMGDMVLVHECAHALADQHFDLRRFIDKAPKADESQAARLAVVEGQAMWIMLEAQLRRMGSSLSTNGAMLDMFSSSMAGSIKGMFPVFDNAPLYLRQTLMFPYLAGLRFQQKAFERYGKQGFSEVLSRPPSTTREVLHPEVWIAGAQRIQPVLPAGPRLDQYKKITDGSIGELDFQILLTQYASEPEAQTVAPQWRAGSFDLHEHRLEKSTVLRWATVWENEKTARDFLALYRKVLTGKWKTVKFAVDSASALEGTGDDGEFRITVAANRVSGIEGLKQSESR